ncbi:MAG: nucleotidyltransferase domain-containing protein, partial [Candidatus Bathyarchaeia archaeon]
MRGYERVQGVYTRLLLLFARRILERYGGRVVSIVLYGSVARGSAGKDSDLDLLLIIEDLPSIYSRRMDELVSLEFDPFLRRELEFLRGEGYAVDFSYVPLTPEEAKSFRPLFLDVLTDGIPIFDRDSFFERQAKIFLGRLSSLGAKRIKTKDGLWYWMVKP